MAVPVPYVAVVLTYVLLSLSIQIIFGLSCGYYHTLTIRLQKLYAVRISIIVDDRTGKKKLVDYPLWDWFLNHRTNGYRTDINIRPPPQTLYFAKPILFLLRMHLRDGKYFEAPTE